MEKPEKVKDALRRADHDALSAMGKVGARNAAFKRDLLKTQKKEQLEEIRIERAKTETISPEGDVLPPDQNIIEEIKNQ